MPPAVIRVSLRDGSVATLRAVGPGDAKALALGFSQLSTQSRVFRFLHHVERLQSAEVDRLTQIDHNLHEAIGATVLESGEEQPAGIAHFFRGPTDPYRAELALTVIDRYQRRGLGVLLLGRLMRVAAGLGVRQFDALVHPANDAMGGLLRALGAAERRAEGTRVFYLPLHRDAAHYPENRVGDAIRAAYLLEPRAACA